MRVLHVIESIALQYGGPATFVVGACAQLEQLGHSTTIVAPDVVGTARGGDLGGVTDADLPLGAERLHIDLYPVAAPRRLAFSPSLHRALAWHVRRADLVHIHNLYTFPQFSAFLHARSLGVPYVVAPCGAFEPHIRARGPRRKQIATAAWQGEMLAGAAGLHYKTVTEAENAEDLGLRAPAWVVPNGVDWNAHQAATPEVQFRARYLNGHRGPLIVNVGRIAEKKALDVLVRSLPSVLDTFPEAHLVLVGPDDEGASVDLRSIARALGVDRQLTLTGPLGGQAKLAALHEAAVWALPSRSENFGLAVVEALAAGCPTVLTPQVNLAETIEADGAGLIREGDPDTFADAIVSLLANPDAADRLGAAGREFARRYDWDQVVPRILEMYEHAVGTGGRDGHR